MKIADSLKRTFEDVRLEVGDKWLADETIVKVDGEPMYLWNIVDYETRIYIASLLTSGRETKDALKAIKEAIKNAGKFPKTIVTDGLKSYAKALEILGLPINHMSNACIAKYENNNRVERLHGTIKDWLKGRRGVKEGFDEIVDSYRIYYNYLRPNTALDKETSAKAEEKWISILLASRQKDLKT